MASYFKNTKKDIILAKEGEEAYRKKTVFVDFLKEKYYLIKFVIIVT